MKKNKSYLIILALVCMTILLVPPCSYSQGSQPSKAFKAEELEQILAPIALYPDSLLTQVLMASTYPLEIVKADRWAKQNKSMKGDALAKALEAEPWDPSVKSMVNFPQVLTMMAEKLDWTQKVGDAFLAQQKEVMGTVQKLRAKAQAAGNLKTTKEQVVKVEKEIIIIEPASPQVIYVPAYNPTVVYGAWAYPAYPPAPVYPPGYVATTAAVSFAAGAAVGAAWGYAWGNANWKGGDVNVNVYQNASVNNSINRSNYATQYKGTGQAGQGQWKHDSSHRAGVAYRDQATAKQYNRAGSAQGVQNREAYRGKTGQGAGGVSTQPAGARSGTTQPAGARPETTDRGGQAGAMGASGRGGSPSPSTMQTGGKQSAFSGMEKGSTAKMEGNRGQTSRQNTSSPQSMQRGGGGARGGSGSSSGSSSRGGSGGGRKR